MQGEHRGARHRTLVLLLAVALVLRIAWWLTQTAVIENEGADYARLAENVMAGRGYVGMLGGPQILFPPLYPALIGLVALPFGNVEVAGRLVSLLSGLALVVVLSEVSRRLFGDAAGLIAGVLTATHPLFVALSVSVYSESLAMVLVMTGAYLAIKAFGTSKAWCAAGAGVAIGCAYLVRPETIAFVGPLALAIATAERRRGGTWACAIGKALVTVSVAGAVALPYVLHLSWLAGQFRWEGKTPINNVINARLERGMSYPEAARGLNSSGSPDDPLQRGPYLASNQRVLLAARPVPIGPMIAAAPRRAPQIARVIARAFYLGAPIIVGLALVGFVGSPWWRERPVEGLLLLGCGLLQTGFLLSLLFTLDRYVFPLLPLIVPWAAAGIERLCSGASVMFHSLVSPGHLRLAFHLVSVLLVLTLTGSLYPAVAALGEFRQASDRSVKQAARWIQQDRRGETRPIVVGYGAALPFHAGATLSLFPFADELQALRYIHDVKPDYIAVRSSETDKAPYVEQWLRRGIADECAERAYEVTSRDGIATRVWRWRCEK